MHAEGFTYLHVREGLNVLIDGGGIGRGLNWMHLLQDVLTTEMVAYRHIILGQVQYLSPTETDAPVTVYGTSSHVYSNYVL